MRRRSKRRESWTLMVNNCPPTKEAEMKFIGSSLALIFFLVLQGTAQKSKIAYPSMAPLPQYLMPRDAEISLARSAAPISLSGDAGILQAVIRRQGGVQTASSG